MHQDTGNRHAQRLGCNLRQQRFCLATTSADTHKDIKCAILIELDHSSAGAQWSYRIPMQGKSQANAAPKTSIPNSSTLCMPIQLLLHHSQTLRQTTTLDTCHSLFASRRRWQPGISTTSTNPIFASQ